MASEGSRRKKRKVGDRGLNGSWKQASLRRGTHFRTLGPGFVPLSHDAFVLIATSCLPFLQFVSEKQASRGRFDAVSAPENPLDGRAAHSLGFGVLLPVVVQDPQEQLAFGVRRDVLGIGDGNPGTSPACRGDRLLHHPASDDGQFRIDVQDLLDECQFLFCVLPLPLKRADLVREFLRPGPDLPLPSQVADKLRLLGVSFDDRPEKSDEAQLGNYVSRVIASKSGPLQVFPQEEVWTR